MNVPDLSVFGGRAGMAQDYPFYPLNSPGMPLPGPDFQRIARVSAGVDPTAPVFTDDEQEICLAWLEYLYRRALYVPGFTIPVALDSQHYRQAEFVPGHIWGGDIAGPQRSDVMLLGKLPGQDEVTKQTNFCGRSSESLYRAFDEVGIPAEISDTWYITNLLRHAQFSPIGGKLKADWIKNCLPLVHEELRLVRPKFVLCIGVEAASALLGRTCSLTKDSGRVMSFRYPVTTPGEDIEYHTIKVMVMTHPANVFRNPSAYVELVSGVRQFWQLVQGKAVTRRQADTRYEVVHKKRHLQRIVDEIKADRATDPYARITAVDAEWHKQYPTDQGAYLRSIQFSHRPKQAFCVALRGPGGEPTFKDWIEDAIDLLNDLFTSTDECPLRVGGQWLRADMPWLIHAGIDLRPHFVQPDNAADTKYRGGWDMGYMVQASNETLPSYKLEVLAARMVGMPRYDVDLQRWKDRYCARNGLEDKDLEGYGECPGSLLYPYGCADADAPRRIFDICNGIGDEPGTLDRDEYGNSSREAYWLAMRAHLAYLEMEMEGFCIDRQRCDRLVAMFVEGADSRLDELRAAIHWPDFNPGSPQQCIELLFGPEYHKLRDKNTGELRRLRPPEAPCFGLKPIKSTAGKAWEVHEERGEAALFSPACDRETLGILQHEEPLVKRLRDVRFLRHVLQTSLSRPMEDADGIIIDEDGYQEYDGGMMRYLSDDGRLRTHIYPKETGRCASSRPNLQNWANRREADYKRILGDQYLFQLRTMVAAPPGYVLVEADYMAAEMVGIAWLSGDPTMIEHMTRAMLPEDHPDFFDPHSNMAVNAFKLNAVPTKHGLEEAGFLHLRVGAKNINFGVPYQRSALAIARQCREEGIDISEAEAGLVIDTYYATYPGTVPYLQECKDRSHDPGWLCGTFGRYRRFRQADDESVFAAQQREACNFPIQNIVADALHVAEYNLHAYREKHGEPDWYRMLVPIHDAILFAVRLDKLEWFVDEVLPVCMETGVPIWPRYLDGSPMLEVKKPYHFKTECEIYLRWKEKLTREVGQAYGIPDRFLPKKKPA